MTTVDGSAMSRQQAVGAASRAKTQQRLVDAAGAEFTAHGYVKSTVSAIAGRAGVTVQTLYLAWGSKRALLHAYLESTISDGAGPPEHIGDDFTDDSPAEAVEHIAALVTAIAHRSATGWKLYRDAAAIDSEIAEDWAEFQRLRRNTFAEIIRNIPPDALRAGLTHDSARDTAWAIASPESYEVLVRHAGYTLEEFQRWMATTLTAALLAPKATTA